MTPVELIALAYGESMPRGDLTTRHLRFPFTEANATLIAREDLVLAGRAAFEAAIRFQDDQAGFTWQFEEGQLILAGQVACWIKTAPAALLMSERVAADVLGRACGIATLTRCYVGEMRDTAARVVNARLSSPGLRRFEFEAVRAGGGLNPEGHYSDVVFVTLNHARAAGSLTRALQLVRAEYSGAVTVECGSLADVEVAVGAKVSRIVLVDLVEIEILAARARVPALIPLEAGGTVSLAQARALAATGVDFVRVDQLTSGAPRAELDITLPAAR